MKGFIGVFTIAAILTVAQSSTKSDYSYTTQDEWPGVCTTGWKQSPINVITRNVQCSAYLSSLQLSNEYFQPISGTFENKGHTMEFIPESNINAIMTTPVSQFNYCNFICTGVQAKVKEVSI